MRKFSSALILFVLLSCGTVFASSQQMKIGLFFDIKEKAVQKDYYKFQANSKDGFVIKKYVGNEEVDCLDCKNDLIYIQKITNQDKFVVYDDNNKFLMAKGDEQIEIISKNGIVGINDNKAYRGSLILKNEKDDKFIIINKLGLEEYLYGVVVKEIGYNAPIEAIKAQAIAARTYAISHKDMYINYGFDITDKYQQVYGGYLSENEKVNSAIDDTKDLVMFYDNKPIKAFYFTSSGGVTEGAENVWGKGEPYLVSVLDEYDLKRKDTSKWMIEFTTDEIQQKLKNKNIDIGKLLDIDVAERSKSRRVIELKYIGSLSTYTLTKNDVRSLLNLKSQLFWIEKENDVYRFYGKGSGHGVGLSQVGAMGMADAGFSFFDILNHYFTGVEIREL